MLIGFSGYYFVDSCCCNDVLDTQRQVEDLMTLPCMSNTKTYQVPMVGFEPTNIVNRIKCYYEYFTS